MYKGTFNICAYDKMFSSRTKMLVFDMAGTTVNENGIVYQTLYETMKKYGLDVSKKTLNIGMEQISIMYLNTFYHNILASPQVIRKII